MKSSTYTNLTAIKPQASVLKISILKSLILSIFFFSFLGIVEGKSQLLTPDIENKEKEDLPVSIFLSENGNLVLYIDNQRNELYNVKILDNKQNVWFEEKTRKGTYSRRFDFTQSFHDLYEVVISGTTQTYKYKLKRAQETKYSLVPLS